MGTYNEREEAINIIRAGLTEAAVILWDSARMAGEISRRKTRDIEIKVTPSVTPNTIMLRNLISTLPK